MGLRIARFSGLDPMSIINEGLARHPDVDEVVNKWHGKKLTDIDEFDIIIGGGQMAQAPGGADYGPESLESQFLEKLAASGKWVIWDQRPTTEIWSWALENTLVYFKKCWKEPKLPKGVHLLTWPVLDLCSEIPADIYEKSKGRDIDIGYYFGWSRIDGLTNTRKKLGKAILEFKWSKDIFIETCYTLGKAYQGYQFYSLEPVINRGINWWLVYMHFLRRTKILFACAGFSKLFQGDRRTAEALSSGALIFADEPAVQMPHPFIHGEHLFFFDSNDNDSTKEALTLANSYLAKEKQGEREAIARAGLEHALKYHRADNYIDYMVEAIKRALKHSNT